MALCFIQLKLKTTWARICVIFKIATYNLDKAWGFKVQKFRSKMDWWFLGFIIAMSGLLAQLILTTYGKGILMQNLLFVVVYALTIVLL